MMTYRHDRARRARSLKIGIGVTGAVFAALVWFTPTGAWVSQGAQYVASPLLGKDALLTNWWTNTTAVFASKQDLLSQNAELKDTISQLSVQLLDRNELAKENSDLRTMLGRNTTPELAVVARVLAGPGKTPYDTLLLDTGSDSGIVKGDRVLGTGDVVIGEVAEVYANTSKAILYSSPGQTVDVVVGDTNIPVTAKGRGSGNFEISVPRDTQVAVGDQVHIPDHNLRLAGTVEQIDETPNDPFKTLLFKSPVNIFNIRWVNVLKNATSS